LKGILPQFDDTFFEEYLKNIDFKDIEIYSIPEGSIVFPRTPIVVVGKLSTLHLLEPYLLSSINTARYQQIKELLISLVDNFIIIKN
jgi:nicotinate phosphoribosyltransferase